MCKRWVGFIKAFITVIVCNFKGIFETIFKINLFFGNYLNVYTTSVMCALPLRRVRVLFEIFSVESEKKSLKYCGLLWPRTIREVVNVVANKTGWRATRTSAFYYLTINVTLSCVFYETPSTPPPPPLPPHVSLAFCLFYRFFFVFLLQTHARRSRLRVYADGANRSHASTSIPYADAHPFSISFSNMCT